MGPKLNLDFLTPDECEKIIDVIQKDLILQHVEQQRISYVSPINFELEISANIHNACSLKEN